MNRVIFGDCRESMRRLIAEGVRVQCCVTSPPYYGLRSYDEQAVCIDPRLSDETKGWLLAELSRRGIRARGGSIYVIYRKDDIPEDLQHYFVRAEIGLESTPTEYVATMVEVFGLVRDLLADDGVLWLNLGDSYANDGKWGGETGGKAAYLDDGSRTRAGRERRITGLKPKDLMGIPWRVAFALQEAGWWLRQDVIWHKPNPMPESARDRCTKSHEYLFLLTKRERYYWDYEAMQEPSRGQNLHDITGGFASAPGQAPQPGSRKSGNKERKPASARGVPVDDGGKTTGAVAGSVPWEGFARNRRSVWTIPTQPYHGAHFAVMPEALVEPCVLATSRPSDIVFDPFMGSGTVARVAQRLGRQWLGCELNPAYEPLQRERTAQIGMPL